MGIAVFPKQSLPRVGKVASGASRIGYWRYEREEGDRLKCAINESTLSTADAVPLPQGGRLRGAALCADFCKRRCPKVVSSHQPLETTHPCFQTTGFKGFSVQG